MTDVLRQHGAIFLGSRLKRLGERLQAGATKVINEAGLPVQPPQIPLLAALEEGALTIGQLSQAVGLSQPGITRAIGQLLELGLVQAQQGDDQRQRAVSLSDAGRSVLARAKSYVLPRVGGAVETLLGDGAETFFAQLADLENALEATPLELLAGRLDQDVLSIREYSDELAGAFHDINAEWIGDMFTLEETDKEVLRHPRKNIIDAGGDILFVEARGLGIVGTCALQKTGEHSFELTKMGVRREARGLKAGEFLLAAVIERAAQLQADPLYLLSNAKCAAAIHLYEKLGFQHNAGIMAQYGARYARCNVAMRYRPADRFFEAP